VRHHLGFREEHALPRPRLGHIQFLNCLPLYYGLVKNDVLLDVDLVKADPAELAVTLVEGGLDIAPIPAIEYARHADELILLPDIAISSDGEVQSILLLSKTPAEQLSGGVVALTNASRTSQVLARILLAKRWGIDATYVEMPPDLAAMMREADAALLIGDDALRAYWDKPTDLLEYDLGTEWAAWTGLPMVYAVWAVRRQFAESQPEATRTVTDSLARSLSYCRAHLEDISDYAARWEPFPADHFRSYFDALQFRFDQRYREGLTRYLAEAVAIGQLDRVPELSVFGEDS
jgi:chorismate dehydratase